MDHHRLARYCTKPGTPLLEIMCIISLFLTLVLMLEEYCCKGLGSASGLKVSGYNACPTCGPEMHGRYSTLLKKTVYHEHRTRLGEGHPMRRNTVFWSRIETRPCPNGPSPEAQLLLCDLMESGVKTKTDAGINRRSILWTLPYWRVRTLLTLLLHLTSYRGR
jgi:hypothetical protein